MSIALILLASFLLYGKSKHFPAHLATVGERLKQNPRLSQASAYGLHAAAMAWLANQFGWGTGIVIWFMMMTMSYCLLLIVLPLHQRFAYVVAGLCLGSILLEILL
ncbi:MAG: hypothetical protein AAF399_03515 [Bacteroidota bacterium]